jgi:hypothetical protein
MRRLLLFIILLFGYFFGFGQKYIQDYNGLGMNLSQQSLNNIEAAIESAIAPLSFDDRSKFRVYDIGFYVHDTTKAEFPYQTFNTWVGSIEGEPESDYYVIFGRFYVGEDVPPKILVNVKLPPVVLECFASDDKYAIDDIIFNEANSIGSFDYADNEIIAIKKLGEKIEYGLKCACYANGQKQPPNPDSTLCKSKYEGFKFLNDKLIGLGFRRKQIEIGGAKTWNNEVDGIYDYFGKEVKINGTPYYIPDEIKDSKAIFDNSEQELPDTTIATSLHGKVFILDDSSFVNNEWNEAFAESQNLDYCEYWVVLTAPGSKHYLYSRFTVGGQMIPVAMMRDENELTDRAGVTLSPWGMALKALGNAAIDAVVQSVIIRIVDPSTNDWGTAWSKVSYLGAAWEGISSLLPWKKDLVSTLVRAATSAFVVVLDNAIKDSNYTVQKGLVDFGVGFAASGITQLVTHPKTVEKIGFGSVYAKIAFSKGIKRIHKSAPPALRKVTLAVQKIIIGNGGNIVKMFDKYEARQYAEIFYRKMPSEHYDNLKSNFKLLKSVNNETSTSPNASFSQSYDGVLVKMWVEPGTIDKLKAIGVRGQQDLLPLLQQSFGNLPHSGKGWHPTKVQFKVETNEVVTPNFKQVNIQLGSGEGVKIFNHNLLYFEKIN